MHDRQITDVLKCPSRWREAADDLRQRTRLRASHYYCYYTAKNDIDNNGNKTIFIAAAAVEFSIPLSLSLSLHGSKTTFYAFRLVTEHRDVTT